MPSRDETCEKRQQLLTGYGFAEVRVVWRSRRQSPRPSTRGHHMAPFRFERKPAPAEMMVELGTYRQTRGLPRLPSPGEDPPLVLPVGRSLKPLTRAALRRIVKDVFGGAAQSLRARGEDHAQRAERLERASAH